MLWASQRLQQVVRYLKNRDRLIWYICHVLEALQKRQPRGPRQAVSWMH
jgi:hypothetical protein